MSSKLPGVAAHVVYAWTRAYTWRLPARARDDRRNEIASDLWESHHDAGGRANVSHDLQVLGRMLAGMPDDVLWRWERPRTRRPGAVIAVILVSTIVIVAALWVVDIAQIEPPELPQRVQATAYPPPPPPPPPPPRPRQPRR